MRDEHEEENNVMSEWFRWWNITDMWWKKFTISHHIFPVKFGKPCSSQWPNFGGGWAERQACLTSSTGRLKYRTRKRIFNEYLPQMLNFVNKFDKSICAFYGGLNVSTHQFVWGGNVCVIHFLFLLLSMRLKLWGNGTGQLTQLALICVPIYAPDISQYMHSW